MELVGGKTAARGAETRLVRVEREMNDHGAMTVRVVETGELRTVVACASSGLRERLASATTESEFPLRLAPSPGRGNSWVALGR
ncbi:hypothetical protein C5B89_00205 [Haloferax sp. Atlit-47N]|uniref:Uncharacterized protein n=1 Tax=Haloferax sp. Atlit-48N TaxID=2077198 RepID=A0ACD5HTB1_9EURY|nr:MULTISPECIES: hypothetical protein [Haloferax]RDZ32215.1 hypothetical protein DEQ67_00205 [Haloferax sp. Atlit-48N]RDZ40406.1 hypothetical protein C5B89_00205 [Haloferax sp. Atlit-47N]WEL25952.1 Uncharacterized protein SVXHx_1643 [Haloferax lucentense]